MTYPVHQVPAGDVLPIFFSTYAGATGASITTTGLAVTDIEIYKDGGATQRASDAGYTLLDTDGIDFDGTTGIHGFSIDTGDNTDAGFYTVGAWFHVIVSAVTVDGQTVNFIAAAFRLMPAESVAGVPKVDVSHVAGTSQTAGDIVADTNDIQSRLPAALVSGRIDASVGAMAANTLSASALAADAVTEIQSGLSTLDAAGVRAAVGLAAADLDTQLDAIDSKTTNLPTDPADQSLIIAATDAIMTRLGAPAGASVSADVAAVKAETAAILTDTAEIGAAGAGLTALASAANLAALDDYVDTEVAAIKAVTDKLDTMLENGSDGWIWTVAALQEAPGGGTGLDAAGVRAAIGLASANLDAQLDALPTAAENAAAVMGSTIEGTFDLTESARLWNAALAGKASGLASTTATFRDLADTKDRIVATVDADGNRTAITRDVT